MRGPMIVPSRGSSPLKNDAGMACAPRVAFAAAFMCLFSATTRTSAAHVASLGSAEPGGSVEKCPAGATEAVGAGDGEGEAPAAGCVATGTAPVDEDPPPPHAVRTTTRTNPSERTPRGTRSPTMPLSRSHPGTGKW